MDAGDVHAAAALGFCWPRTPAPGDVAINDPLTMGPGQPPRRLICLPGTARRHGPGKLQAVRPPEHQNPLKAEGNGQVEDNGGGP